MLAIDKLVRQLMYQLFVYLKLLGIPVTTAHLHKFR